LHKNKFIPKLFIRRFFEGSGTEVQNVVDIKVNCWEVNTVLL